MPINSATTDYLAEAATAITAAHDPIRTNARTVSGDLATLRRSIADRTELLFAVDLDETTPDIRALAYETNDKLKTLDRLAMDAQEMMRRLIIALGEDEAMTARVQQVVDAAGGGGGGGGS